MREAFINDYDLNYTQLLFYPDGLDLTLQPKRWTSYPLWALYFQLFGEPTAYNLTVLTQSLIKAYAMYRLILLFVPHQPSAWIGGAFFAFSARVLSLGIQQPNTGSLEFIPIFMIFFVLALRRIADHKDVMYANHVTAGLMVLAGIAFSANVYMNIKIGIFAMFVGGAYVVWSFVYFRLWNRLRFWFGITIFAIVCLVLSAPMLIPTLTHSELSEAIYQELPAEGIDLFAYLKPDPSKTLFHNQFIASFDNTIIAQGAVIGLGQIGFISIVLSGTGMLYVIRKRHEIKSSGVFCLLSVLYCRLGSF